MSEALAGDAERAGGLLHLVGFVAGGLGVLHLGQLQVLAHAVKVLLGLLELAHVPDDERHSRLEKASGLLSGAAAQPHRVIDLMHFICYYHVLSHLKHRSRHGSYLHKALK